MPCDVAFDRYISAVHVSLEFLIAAINYVVVDFQTAKCNLADLAQVLFIIWRRSAKRVWAGLFLSNGPMPEQFGITDQEQIWARPGSVQLLMP